jgi:hypothetical protein
VPTRFVASVSFTALSAWSDARRPLLERPLLFRTLDGVIDPTFALKLRLEERADQHTGQPVFRRAEQAVLISRRLVSPHNVVHHGAVGLGLTLIVGDTPKGMRNGRAAIAFD